MINERVDLYDYFGIARGKATGGYLAVCASEVMTERTAYTRPAMVIFPGGGYSFLSQREAEPIAMTFGAEGYAPFILYYSLGIAYPVPLIEACMAVAYVRKNASRFAVDVAHVAAVGFSAGGNLAAMLATMFADKAVNDVLGALDVKPDAVILGYAVATTGEHTSHGETSETISGGDRELRKRISPDLNVTADSVPVFIWHTMEDDCVPVEGALLYAEACRAHNVPFALHIFEHGCHGLSICDGTVNERLPSAVEQENVAAWVDLALAWLRSRGFRVRFK